MKFLHVCRSDRMKLWSFIQFKFQANFEIYLFQISGLLKRHISGKFKADQRHIPSIYKMYIRHISGVSQLNCRHKSGISDKVRRISGILQATLSLIFCILTLFRTTFQNNYSFAPKMTVVAIFWGVS